jgi:hypothetical protein
MLTRPQDQNDIKGARNEQIWNSVFHFRCPIPDDLQNIVSQGSSIVDDQPSIYIDLVPIRTPAREARTGYCPQISEPEFDPKEEWGDNHILPPVEKSGRWSNIPICQPPKKPKNVKQHYLIGCMWASAAFSTRGPGASIDDSVSLRLLEWLTYHLYIAKIDHVYIYDNTEAHRKEKSLKQIIDIFPPDRVTRIPWKHRVCNNNRPMHQNSGERSSQYTAEASCRLRYGPFTEWIAQLDPDEYFVPSGNWTDIQSWLRESVAYGHIGKDTHILSFFQTRAIPNFRLMETYDDGSKECKQSKNSKEPECLAKINNVTFLQEYDCERTSLPKPNFGWRAKKQIYRPSVSELFVYRSDVCHLIINELVSHPTLV